MRLRHERCAPRDGATQRILGLFCLLGVAALVFACLDTGIPGYQTNFPVTGVLITPPVASLSPGDHVQFQAKGVTQNGDSVPVVVLWSARFGTITADGLYTAPASGQEDVVTARVKGTAYADSAVVTLVPSAVATVNVIPAQLSLYVNDLKQLSAVVLNAAGDTLTGRPLAWSSTNQAVATVSSSGVVSGFATGNSTVSAATGGKVGTSTVTVLPRPQSGTWPDEPSSFPLIAEQPWSILSSLGWFLEFGTASIGLDVNAPESPPGVLQITYPSGFAGGSAPGTESYNLNSVHNLFVGMWWKPSNPWQGHITGSNKIQYAFTNENGSITMVMYGPVGGPYELRVFPQFSVSPLTWLTPNVAHVPVQLGVWHRIEWLLVYSSDASTPNGIVKWWLDGQLIGDYENVVFPGAPLTFYKLDPVWGGVDDVKNETDYYWFDQIHISGQ